MTTKKTNLLRRGGFAAPLLTLAVVLVVSGSGFRWLGRYLDRPTDSVPLPAGTLANVPSRLGAWTGQDVAVDAAIRDATDSDDLLKRRYRRGLAGEEVMLYVAYGVNARDLMPHRPEVCYPGAGWSFIESNDFEVPLAHDSRLLYRILRFSRGGLDARQIVVLNYFLVDGQYCPDVSLLRSKSWRGSKGIRYMMQVQIACTTGPARDYEAARGLVTSFARDSADPIREVLSDALAAIANDSAHPAHDLKGGEAP